MGIEDLKFGMKTCEQNKYTCKPNDVSAKYINESTEDEEASEKDHKEVVDSKVIVRIIKKLLMKKIHNGETEVANDPELGHCVMIREDETDDEGDIHITYSLAVEPAISEEVKDEVDSWLKDHGFITLDSHHESEIIFGKLHKVPEGKQITETKKDEPEVIDNPDEAELVDDSNEEVSEKLSEDEISTIVDALTDFIDTLDEEDSRKEELATIITKLTDDEESTDEESTDKELTDEESTDEES